MAKTKKVKNEDGDTIVVSTQERAEGVPVTLYGSEEHRILLETGYGMSVEHAKQIIEERQKNPIIWPYEEFAKAKAMLEQLEAVPQAVSKKKGWKRSGAKKY